MRLRIDFIFGAVFVFILTFGILYPYLSTFNPSNWLLKLLKDISYIIIPMVVLVMFTMAVGVMRP